MYVTDVPVHERMTRSASVPWGALEGALADLDIEVEAAAGRLTGEENFYSTNQDSEVLGKSLSGVRDAVLKASEHMGEALSLLGIEAL